MVLASFGGASIVFVALVMMRTPSADKPVPKDPLGDLVAQNHPAGAPRAAERLAGDDVSFPAVLSDQKAPTTAMELVRSSRKRAGAKPIRPDQSDQVELDVEARPPTPSGRLNRSLTREPVPAGDVLFSDRVSPPAQDNLRRMANTVNEKQERGGAMVDSGRTGGYQLQVSSFKSLPDAQTFAAALRRRGHRSHVESAQVKGRGLWHRVRIGPFKYKRSAMIYRQDFEAKERLVSFVVNPPKTRVRIGLSED